MKKFLLASALVLTVSGLSHAKTIYEADGIVYEMRTGAKACVVNPTDNGYSSISYSGEMTIPATVEYEGTTYQVTEIASQCFANNKDIVRVNLPEGLKTINGNSFMGSSITDIVIPNSVTEIGLGTFQFSMNLKTVTIGTGVTKIGSSAFNGCAAITDVYCLGTVPPVLSYGVFGSNITNTAVLHVPAEALEVYKTDSKWSVFKNIVATGGTEVVPAESIELSQNTVTGKPGDTVTLTATVMPENATDKTVNWSSSDETVATVSDEGVVSLLAVGNATVTASCGDISAECIVTVESVQVGVDEIMTDSSIVEYYNLQGVRVTNPGKGMYIRRQGIRTEKVNLR